MNARKLLGDNFIFRLFLGICPTVAVLTTLENGLGMGFLLFLTLLLSNIIISMLRKMIPSIVKIICYLLVATFCVTFLQIIYQGSNLSFINSLGIYVPLLAVNSLFITGAGEYAYTHHIGWSALNSLLLGLFCFIILVIISFIRELFGLGTLYGVSIFTNSTPVFAVLQQPAAGFILLGCFAALSIFLCKKFNLLEKV